MPFQKIPALAKCDCAQKAGDGLPGREDVLESERAGVEALVGAELGEEGDYGIREGG
jgi:hypothetical protein